ncbi:rhodanese-like domain-containing protein [Olleya namhaensis]|uniref:Rhodanese-related sulfurtransferase n=1 Tax=Olleya namhaensis TaxID=1144750 RepID=A0A1I3LEW3_9FLAO|nr:rhodanese-like domain-containing protein [Olleya namhaensis]SFI83016.1 Rhodanese-related sulfurtransferase [Olleya namhaensis]
MKTVLFLFISLFAAQSIAQDTLDELLKKHNKNSVPYITVQELAMPITDAVILDAREPKEFEVSHIKNAILVGYDFFDIKTVTEKHTNKDQKIVVYCSLGIRSETIAKKLKDEGYTNVLNLYGGIFEWKNNDFIVVDSEEKETNKVHTFNEAWSKWLKKGDKIYEEEPKTEKKKTRKKSKK